MRDLLPPIAAGLLKVESYGQEGFTIGGRLYTHSLLLFPDRTIPWPHKKISDWRLEDFAAVTAMIPAIEVLLLGTGSTHQFVNLMGLQVIRWIPARPVAPIIFCYLKDDGSRPC